jgi:hypothetical protein
MAPILADIVWPALFLGSRLSAWWVIGLGLIVELFFVRWLTTLNWSKSFVADVSMNAASALLGGVLIALVGLGWEFFPGTFIHEIFQVGTFNPGTWAATFLFAVFINAGLETLVLRFVFKQKAGKRIFWWLCVANSLSVAVAFVSIFLNPPQP